MTVRLRFSAATHVGKKRQVNEDSILSLPDQKIWVVSDGMGGHDAGDFASQTVVDCVALMPPSDEPAELMSGLRSSLHSAHKAIRHEAERRGGTTIGATVVALTFAGNHFAAFWAGDSRLYRLQADAIEMLTTDHSTVAELVLAGEMSWDEAEHHPQSNAITRAVGVGEDLEIDKIRGEVFPGDRFLLCSDGLTKYATFAILEMVLKTESIETVTDRLLDIALTGGGGDNISIIVIDVV
ncbi:MAG: protein phosphatase 2C domain-containing protein [Paracoccaceae bacterium]